MSDTKMNDLQKQRLDKLEKIKSLNIDPYPQPNLKDKNTVSDALEMVDKTVIVAGRILSKRGQGKISFADLHDRTDKIQLFFEFNTLGEEKMNLSKLLDLGDIISATGVVFKTQAGEITIRVETFQILTKNMKALPEKWHGLQDVEERYRQRYVDLIVNPEVKEVFLTRTKILTLMRRFLDDHGFIEVETPILQPVYGGAAAKPFITHHNVLDTDMYLRISDELYLKRLIVGGFEKVYEVSRDFRNEGVSRFHNPEFTQIEFYWAYVDYNVLMEFTEKLIEYVLQNVKGTNKITFQNNDLDFKLPIKRLTFRDAIFEKTKIDIDQIKNEKQFLNLLKENDFKLDLNGVVGLGALFDAFYKEYVRPYIIQPTFITDYPSSMIALAKRKENNPDKIASFQLVACGAELLKAYNELNDPKDQLDRWLDEEALAKKGAENTMQIDTDYIRALEYGMPPTAGWGMGIDRFTQFVTDQASIKDVILFPTMKPERNENDVNIEKPKKEIVKESKCLPDENSKKFVAILNKKIPFNKLSNALGHMTAGLAGSFPESKELCFLQYQDKDNGIHPNISHFPFIVLAAENSNQIRNIRRSAIEKGISFTDFTSTMTIGTSKDQLEATQKTYENELEYFGICLFGSTEELKNLTKKFSLFK